MALIQKAFSDIITFSRSSNATRVGPTGVLEYAPHNLLLQSQTFDNASWTKTDSSITANAIAAPDGTVTADKLVENSSAATHQVSQGVSVTSGVPYTVSIYVKAGERTKFQVNTNLISAGFVYITAKFDISAGTVISVDTGLTASIQSVGNGWYRCIVTGTAGATTSKDFIFNLLDASGTASYTGDGTSGIYLWGAQLAVGPYALDYVPTTSAAVYGPRFDYDGSGVTIVEPVSTNLLTYSQEFENAAWTKVRSSISANTTIAPDGTVTADSLIENSGSNTHYVSQSFTSSSVSYTTSVYAKANTRQWLAIRIYDAADKFAFFNLSTGVVGTVNSGVSATIISVGNGWYRCTHTYAFAAGASTEAGLMVAIADNTASYTGDGTSGIFIWSAQLEVGSTATAYMVSGASNGFRAVPVVSGSATAKGLLVEEQRQNLLPASNDFSNVTYWTGGGSVTANATTSPDGTVNAAIGASINPASGVGDATVAISGSIFAKANPSGASSLVVRINRFGSGTDYLQVTFNLSTGVAGSVTNSGTASGGSASMTAFGNGWYRCVLSGTASTTAGTLSFNPQSTCFIYGAQLEAGSFATSLIPTLASAVTRSADVASVNTLSPWFNSSASTLYSEFDIIGPTGATGGYITQLTASGDNGLMAYQDGAGTRQIRGYVSGSSVLLGTVSDNTTVKFAVAYNGSSNAALINGNAPSSVGTTLSATPTRLSLGSEFAGAYFMNGHLRRVAYYPRRLTNAELQALTS